VAAEQNDFARRPVILLFHARAALQS
jgi:hypothetical protein